MNQAKVDQLNEVLSDKSAEEILRFVVDEFGDKICFASSMGAEDQVVAHIAASLGLPLRIFTLDTGRMFYETYDLIEKTQKRYDIDIEIFFPQASQVEKMVKEKGINLFYYSIENRKECCGIRKIKPLNRALEGMQAWITGLRREQSPTRTHLRIVEWDHTNNMIKINPLLEWSEAQLWDFIKAHKIPYNSLHDRGFPSIGCQPCTRAVLPGEDVRSGRWWWENPETKECGLHNKS